MNSTLSSGTIEVRYVRTDGAGEGDYAMLRAQLPADEQANAERYLHLRDRLAFATARVLLRKMLSNYSRAPTGGWRLTKGKYGKPALVRTGDTPDFQFNISHCAGMVAVAVSLGHEVGVDVESILGRNLDHLGLARAHFSVEENHFLNSSSADDQRELFYELWTLKEAYFKALGRGFSEKFSGVSSALNPLAISFPAESPENAGNWFFMQDKPTALHRMGVAVRRQHPDEEINCRIEEISLAEIMRP